MVSFTVSQQLTQIACVCLRFWHLNCRGMFITTNQEGSWSSVVAFRLDAPLEAETAFSGANKQARKYDDLYADVHSAVADARLCYWAAAAADRWDATIIHRQLQQPLFAPLHGQFLS